MERYRVKVHKKGLIVIPARVRRKLGISEGSHLEMIVEDNVMRIVVPKSLRDVFAVDGERALEVVRLITASRREEMRP